MLCFPGYYNVNSLGSWCFVLRQARKRIRASAEQCVEFGKTAHLLATLRPAGGRKSQARRTVDSLSVALEFGGSASVHCAGRQWEVTLSGGQQQCFGVVAGLLGLYWHPLSRRGGDLMQDVFFVLPVHVIFVRTVGVCWQDGYWIDVGCVTSQHMPSHVRWSQGGLWSMALVHDQGHPCVY